MTVSSTAAASGPYIGTGTSQTLPFTFHAASAGEIAVRVDGIPVTGFSVTLESDGTGSVVGTFASGATIYIESDPSFQQEAEFNRFAPVFPDAFNPPLDRAAIRDIALKGQIDRAPVVPRDPIGMVGKFPTIGDDGTWQYVDGVPGVAGPANSTFTSLSALKAAPLTNGTYTLLTAAGRNEYAFLAGDYRALADDHLIVALDAVPLQFGALVTAGVIDASLFGVSTNNPDNGPAYGRMLAAARYRAVQYATPPLISHQSGIFRTSGLDANGVPLNWAVQGLTILAQPGVVLLHTGEGVAFPCDGGATGGGVAMMKVLGGIVVRGNPQTTDGVWNRAIHHSTFDMEVQEVSGAVLRTNWAVCNEYWIRSNPLFRPAFTTVASVGAFLSSRATGERTSACNFYNPIFGGINGYCWNFDDALMNNVIGGTSETSVGGAFFGVNGFSNTMIRHDFEFNTLVDIFCGGSYNRFDGVLSDLSSEFGGLLNKVSGGLWNEIKSYGDANDFEQVNYGIAGGAFIDTGTNTNRKMMRNAIGVLEPDIINREIGVMQIGKMAGGLRVGRADITNGGSDDDIVFSVQAGVRAYFDSASGPLFGWSDQGIGFFNRALGPHVGVPAITGSRASGEALQSLIVGLASLGMITDNTTA